jgi:NADPH-dependent curcumin reductase CurA
VNRRIILVRRPDGAPTADCFARDDAPIPSPGPGQALVRMRWLAIDAGMINRLRAEENYAARVEVGDVMHGTGIGEVIESRVPALPAGRFVRFMAGWQEYATVDDQASVVVIDDEAAKLPHHLAHLGMSGIAAYLGMVDVLQPEPGHTVVVSSAAGAVGSVAGQIARLMGARVVGLAGSAERGSYVTERLGFDSCVNYRAPDFANALAAALPGGVDRYFDNVGGAIAEALLSHYNVFGRIAVCGRTGLSHLADSRDDIGQRDHNTVLVKRLTKRGFLVYDHIDRHPVALAQLRAWHDAGELVVDHTITDGIDSAPAALEGLLAGHNFGKQLVRLDAAR